MEEKSGKTFGLEGMVRKAPAVPKGGGRFRARQTRGKHGARVEGRRLTPRRPSSLSNVDGDVHLLYGHVVEWILATSQEVASLLGEQCVGQHVFL